MNEATIFTHQLSGFLRLDQVLQLIPVSKATWWNGCRSGLFPKPYKLAPRVTAWKLSDIQKCLDTFPLSAID
ncbi:helix-turn-helix transcriptional regulator [Fibrella forsythiae]|uniref:AlpA family phage regulatory protein n=1 Tax=Fibrella forsythiae TaxID=2817061 RepID=A0ABS3JMC1_9BACT|nr:AlpA family phage regulatory protein [Fibrella forsythiae]MBO0950608.1 AlpA family phage regulatory protein [Fibrella forsythiae]